MWAIMRDLLQFSPLESTMSTATKVCKFCRSNIDALAMKCPKCQEWLTAKREQQPFNPGIAVLLSILIPGAGMLYRGKVLDGIVWLVLVFGVYWFVMNAVAASIPLLALALLLHVVCIIRSAI